MNSRKVVFTAVAMAIAMTSPAFCATSAIGFATAPGSFAVDSAPVTGTSEIVSGSVLETTVSPSDIRLQNGAGVRLATRSSGVVYDDHVVLQQGAIRMTNFANYPVEIGAMRIEANSPSAQAVVRIKNRVVEVASLGGDVNVMGGLALVARVAAGTKMAFESSAQQQTGSNGNPTGNPPAQSSTTTGQSGATAGQSGATPGQTGATPAQTGATPVIQPVPEKGPMSDKKAFIWAAVVCGVAAIVVGSIAAAQGKSPF